MRRFFLFLLILASSSAAVSTAYALPVDLTALDIYVREGFDPSWAAQGPSEDIVAEAKKQSGDARWIKSDTARWLWLKGKAGKRSVRAIDLGLSNLSSRRLFALGVRPVVCTYCIPLSLSTDDFSRHALGLFLPQIGQNWEIYLNGTLVKSELHLSSDGSIRRDRSVRDQIVELPSSLLKEGSNLLSFRIVGDPTKDDTGFSLQKGYLIGRYDSLQRHVRNYADMALIGICMFLGLYHLLLFIRRRQDFCNLSFGLAAVLLSLYYSSCTSAAYQLLPDARIVSAAECVSLIMLLSCFAFFADTAVRGKVSLFTKLYFAYSFVAAFLAVPFEREIFFIWKIFLVIPLLYIVIYDIALPLSSQTKEILSSRERGGSAGMFAGILSGFFHTMPGNLALCMSAVLVTGIIDAVSSVKGGSPSSMKYGVFILFAGISVMLAYRFFRIHSDVEDLSFYLEKKIDDRTKDLEQANEEISAAAEELASVNEALASAGRELDDAKRTAESDMAMAARVQAGFFPKHSPVSDEWDIAFAFKPMTGVSGDLYDFYHKDDRFWGASLFEVSGRSIASGILTLFARSVFLHRFMTGGGEKLNRIVEQINHDLIAEIGTTDHFLSGILLRIDDDHIEYVNAGHPDLLFRKGDTCEVKAVDPKGKNFKGSFLGAADMEGHFNIVTFRMLRGDMVLMHSDCLNEGMNPSGEEFGVERIMKSFNAAPKDGTSHEILEYIVHDFLEFVGSENLQDDLTAVLIRRTV